VYVYRCQECGTVIERRQSFSDAPLTVCESCGGELRKVLQPVGIIFKGSGFYYTDHRNNGSSKATESKSTGDDHAESTTKSDSSPSTPTSTPAAKTEKSAPAAAAPTSGSSPSD
jgi:putative FmdB family regulatory protein